MPRKSAKPSPSHKSKSPGLSCDAVASGARAAAVGTQQPLPSARRMAAATELLKRRTARKSLIEFCMFTHPRYQPAWFHEIVAQYIEFWQRGLLPDGIMNIMVYMPPRSGKSELGAVRGPAFDLIEHDDEHYIATAYGDELATTFSRACRNVVMSPQYQRIRPHKLKNKGDTHWEIVRKNDDQRATYISSGILSALTGEGATRLVIDDPVKNEEEAYSKKIRDKIHDNYQTAVSTRLAPGGRKLLQMTRWHEDDLGGRLLKKAKDNPLADQWIVLVFAATNDNGDESYILNTKTQEKVYFAPYKALWPEAYPREELDRTRANIGTTFWNALYMQRPVAATGGIFKRDNWSYYTKRPEVDLLVQVWDTAFAQGQENDYSACVTMGATTNGQFPIFNAWRDKPTFGELVAKVYASWQECADLFNRYPDRILVENKGSGISLIQQIETNNLAGMWTFPPVVDKDTNAVLKPAETRVVPFIPVTPMPATQSKLVRAQGISGYHEAKGLLLPSGAEWVADFVDEHALFDKGVHDDWVDCTVHGVTYYVRPIHDQEHRVEYGEAIHINSDIDEYELHEAMTGRGSW